MYENNRGFGVGASAKSARTLSLTKKDEGEKENGIEYAQYGKRQRC